MTTGLSPWRTALVGFTILVLAMGIGRFLYTPILPIMQSEGLLTVSTGGILASVHFIGYAMGSLLAARLTWSPKLVLFASLLAISLSTAAMGLSDRDWVWYGLRWIAGVCSAIVLVIVSTHFLTRLAAMARTDLQGLVFAGVGCGIALAGLGILAAMVAGIPSGTGWQIFGYASLFVTIVLFTFLLGNTFFTHTRRDTEQTSSPPLNWLIILPYGAMGAGYIIPATYLPVMAREIVSSPLVFGWSWPVFGMAAAISTIVSARLHASVSNRKIWVTSQLIMALGLLVPAVWMDMTAIVIGGVCVGGTFMVITMAGLKEAHRLAGSVGVQKQVAAMTAAFAIGQIVGPALAGWVYNATLSFFYPLLIGSLMLSLTLLPMMGSRR